MKQRNYHVTPNFKGGWDVIRERGERASRHTATQAEAVSIARQFCQRNHSELIIHGKDGRIQQKDSHGRDPFPPRG